MIERAARIFVVDDDASVRRSLERLLRAAGLPAETFASADEFLERVAFDGPSCLILDVAMPKTSGPELQERLIERGLGIPIVFLTGHGDIQTGVGAMKKGAVDFLLKPVDDELLLTTVRAALEEHARELERAAKRQEIVRRIATLTPREHEVLEQVVRGKLNKQIASALEIAEKTVKVHRAQVMAKMAAGSVAELVRLCELAATQPARHAE